MKLDKIKVRIEPEITIRICAEENVTLFMVKAICVALRIGIKIGSRFARLRVGIDLAHGDDMTGVIKE